VEWDSYRDFWESYGVQRQSCAEIGCGAGRMTRQLARYFDRVEAIDISEDMIAYARRLLPEENVHFHVNDGVSLPLQDGSVTAVFSTFVFQHFDNTGAAARIFREIHRMLVDGGTMAIQLPVHLWPRPEWAYGFILSTEVFLIQRYTDFWRWRLRRGKGKPVVTYLTYDVEWLVNTLTRMGFGDVSFHIIPSTRSSERNSILYARKRASSASARAATLIGRLTTP
jgi:SAM-dependent methyltransferase